MKKAHPLLKIVNNAVIDLPTPNNINLWWNFGSLSGICLIIQIISGLFLTFRFCPDTIIAFDRVRFICREINNGWIIRTIHANGASLFFFCLYLHIGRGLYYQSYKFFNTWSLGVILFLTTIGTAFLGYVLPWGQMSFWGASVITSLINALPYLGAELVQWVWGGFSVDNPTLTRFFGLHFLLPFLILGLVIIHLLFLHQTGSNNPLGLNRNKSKIPFHPYFSYKDIIGFILIFLALIFLILFYPYLLSDPDNFIPANPLITPIHIQPEWYFLFAYAILRSIPNKLGGVIALLMSIIILFFMPLNTFNKFQGHQFYPVSQFFFWSFISSVVLLTWIGMRPVEAPFILTGQILTIIYFSSYIINPLININWDKLLI